MFSSEHSRPRALRKLALTVAGLSASGLLLSGCAQDGIYALPLPGGADLGSDPIRVTMEFDKVPEIFPQTMVKVDGVPVGMIDKVGLTDDGWRARIEILLRDGLNLPANSTASVQQTSLLGEKFVMIEVPEGDASGERIVDGSLIGVDNTRVQVEIEDIFGALSLLLNGGGVAQIQSIVEELNTAFDGREPQVKQLLEQTNIFVNSLNNQRAEIQRAFDNLDVMSARLADQRDAISRVVEEIPVGTQILAEQTPDIMAMLREVNAFGVVGADVISRAREDLVADLRALRPTLQALANSGADFPVALGIIPTFPIPDAALDVTLGGSMNAWLAIDLSVADTLRNLGIGEPLPVYVPPYGQPQPVIDPNNPYIGGNGPRPGPGTMPIGLPQLLPAGLPIGVPPGPIQDLLNSMGVGQP